MKHKRKTNQKRQPPSQNQQPVQALTDEQSQQVVGGLGTTSTPLPSNDEVVVAFESSDVTRRTVLGKLWKRERQP